jgi:Serine hydroxymethyltransferase
MSVLDQRLSDFDPEIAELIGKELERQRSGLEMIASENHAPLAVMQAQGSVLTNRYAEGYPGRRYYGGCEHVDVIEQLAIDRIKALFDAEFANVQPHSGAQSNAAVMHALLKPGDTILGLSLDCGGHLTHGMRLNFSGKLYNVVAYGVSRNDYLIDMDQVAELAREHRPQVINRGLVGLPAPPGLRPIPGDRRRGGCVPDGRHGPLRGPGGRRAAPLAGAARPRSHVHHAQDPRRPARRNHPHERGGHRQEAQLGGLPGSARLTARA